MSILPLMVIGLPRLYGAWHHVMTGLLQHLGLAENVTDHRLNTRTVLMNPISRFIYLNMNYHVKHHMFTMVPYYQLPELHELIKNDLPAPEVSIFNAFRKLLPVLVKQLRYKDAVIIPELPEGTTPYRQEVERLRPFAIWPPSQAKKTTENFVVFKTSNPPRTQFVHPLKATWDAFGLLKRMFLLAKK
jgi:fatty acid desaturase